MNKCLVFDTLDIDGKDDKVKTKKARDFHVGDVFFADREIAECTVHVSRDTFYTGFKIIELGGGEQFRVLHMGIEAFGSISIFASHTTTKEPCSFSCLINEDIVIEQ